MPRILSIWLPQLPLDRLTRQGDPRLSGAFAVIAEESNAWRLTHVNDAGLRAGVKAGQALADARAICPDLLTEPSDPVREELLLRALLALGRCTVTACLARSARWALTRHYRLRAFVWR